MGLAHLIILEQPDRDPAGGASMERPMAQGIAECADCGAPVDVALDRGYAGPGNWVLCHFCAGKRGAQFDANEDCWTVPPDSTGLSAHRVPRER